MPSNLVRVTIDKEKMEFAVEYGEVQPPGLSELEEAKFKQLNEDLIEYSDFTEAENLEDEERQQLMEKKKRLEELAEKRTQENVSWYPIEEGLIESLLIICEPGMKHTYVENLPGTLLRKLFDPQMTFNFGNLGHTIDMPCPRIESCTSNLRGPQCTTNAHKDCKALRGEAEQEAPADDVAGLEGVTQKELNVIAVIASAQANWKDYVSVKEENGVVHVRPHKFLGDVWGPINAALKKAYGDPWKSKGSGDREAHWEIIRK